MRLIPFDYAVRNLFRSPRRVAAIVLGNALVVLLLISASSFIEGMRASFAQGHASSNIIVLGTGSEESVERSEVGAAVPGLLAASIAGIRSEGGELFLSPEISSAIVLRESKDSPRELRGIIRGVTPAAFLVHQSVEIIDGRAPVAGRNEFLAGSLAAEKLGLPAGGLQPGSTLWFDGRDWTVSGIMRAQGSVIEAELWTPVTDLMVATRRDSLSCVVLTPATAEFADVDAWTKMRPDLELTAIPEAEYYASLLRFYRPVQAMIWLTAVLIALSGVLGGLNTLYAAFASRVREFATLQALGFPRRAIVLSLVQEGLLAASLGFFVAAALAKLALEGLAVSFSMGVFQLLINSQVLLTGAVVGLVLGVLGAMPPAFQCLRLPIPEALKSAGI